MVGDIQVCNLSKIYQVYDKPQDRLLQSLWPGKKKFYREFWALRDINLSIYRGDTIGLIGRNGSGKSTLLQVLAGILTPSVGEVNVAGRVAALLELGSGFNPEFTGRENIRMNGIITGLSPDEMEERIPLIEKFAEIGDFIDQPVRTYSSGMFVRLAFACAVHIDPDILIIDEALAVGDMHFQLKCIDKMKSFKKQNKTILFVSHDIYSIKNFCDQAIWMMDGRVHMRGNVNTVAHEYEEFMKIGEEVDEPVVQAQVKPDILTINQVMFFDQNQKGKKDFSFGEDIIVQVDYTLHAAVNENDLVGGVAIFDKQNHYLCGLNTKLDGYLLPHHPGKYKLLIHYRNVQLLPGTYFVDVGFFEGAAVIHLDYKSRFDYFRIVPGGAYFAEGVTFIEHQWECKK